jgi:hypothetical protein
MRRILRSLAGLVSCFVRIARRVFNMSRFTSLGTIVVEWVCDGLVLVSALRISLAWILSVRFELIAKPWIFLVGAIWSAFFGLALVLILFSRIYAAAE